MKLELKHLAGYLPYGLKVRTNIGDLHLTCLINYDTYKAWFHYKFNSNDKFVNYNLKNNTTTDNSSGKGFMLKEIKPILRPLSDLTKEIEVSGEKFTPLTEILNCEYYGYSELRYMIQNNNFYLLPAISHQLTEKLLEWHFDIYGLIENKLAIDINTLNS